MRDSRLFNWRAFVALLVVSSICLALAGAVVTGMTCGWDFLLYLFEPGHCLEIGSPATVWAGAVATFGIGMKFFWFGLGVWVVWRSRRRAS